MRYPALLAMFLVLISGCTIVFDGLDGGDDDCLIAEPAIAPAPLRNPETLTCESFGGDVCPDACGPCPLAETPAGGLEALPAWGGCGSPCEGLAESACAQSAECRVVKDAACAVSPGCSLDFFACLPISQVTRTDIDCFAARDGFTCSQSAACTAYHRASDTATPGFTSPERVVPFAMCAPEGKSPGRCHAAVSCDRVAPACPTQTMPGIENGCYTGACIPLDVCEPAPQP